MGLLNFGGTRASEVVHFAGYPSEWNKQRVLDFKAEACYTVRDMRRGVSWPKYGWRGLRRCSISDFYPAYDKMSYSDVEAGERVS